VKKNYVDKMGGVIDMDIEYVDSFWT